MIINGKSRINRRRLTMSKAGDVLVNPINGNKIVIGTVTEELVEVELFLNPGKPS
jgi:hypothetical protein